MEVPGGKVDAVVSYPDSERSELVALLAELAPAGVWGRSSQRVPGAEPLAGG